MKLQDELKVSLERLHASLGNLAAAFENLGSASIPACDRMTLIMEQLNSVLESGPECKVDRQEECVLGLGFR